MNDKLIKLTKIFGIVMRLPSTLEKMQLALGRIEGRLSAMDPSRRPSDHEFQVFSQWGEDGILHFLTTFLPVKHRTFVELGVENYQEANTRFLAQNFGWSGLIVDGSEQHMAQVKNEALYWRSHLTARSAFITRENVNTIVSDGGMRGKIGLLSIDLDGNDYWIWKELQGLEPEIVVVEYNALFGAEHKVSVPYDKDFARGEKHYSHLYFGASLAAFHHLARERGYSLVDVNSAGCNAFFVKDTLLENSPLEARSPAECYRPPVFRESRDAGGQLTFADARSALHLLRKAELPLVEVDSGKNLTTASL